MLEVVELENFLKHQTILRREVESFRNLKNSEIQKPTLVYVPRNAF